MKVAASIVFLGCILCGCGNDESPTEPEQPQTATWRHVGVADENGWVFALNVYDGALIAGGEFVSMGGVATRAIAHYNGTSWSALGTGFDYEGRESSVYALAVYQGQLYAGGRFTSSGGTPLNYVARWDGSAWHPLADGVVGEVRCLCEYQGSLYVGGDFSSAGGVPARGLARWDGTAWSIVGQLEDYGPGCRVEAMTVWRELLVLGGAFGYGGTIPSPGVVAWNGQTWSAVGSGTSADAEALAVFANDLIAGGDFSTAGGSPARFIARWNGSVWSALGGGFSDLVYAVAVHRDHLVAAGDATVLHRWTGTAWEPLGTEGRPTDLNALLVWQDRLYAGGWSGIFLLDE